MNIKQVRDTVEVLLTDLLGSYTLPDGTIIPAIYVDGKYGVPKSWKVSGLEASIKQYPLRRSRPLLVMVEMRMSWEIVLSQYSPSAEDMDEAIDRVLRHFPDTTLTGFPSSDREYQYARLVVPDLEIKTQYLRAN
ncbi:MAG: hypothetical protein CML73_05720 [Rhodobiaceae bacterium]|jgi:hypothetical protein|nr:hypothetical protein [Rhodobiaceae bacterium]